jgi:hypothetical protein
MKTSVAAIITSLSLVIGALPASAVELFNGLSTPSQTPAQQGWQYLATYYPLAPTLTATNQGTVLDTTGQISNYASFFRQSPLALNRTTGYDVKFRVRIEDHNSSSNNNAGFSIIVMSNLSGNETQPYGIDLGFWESSIWAKNANFTRGESVSLNTGAMQEYRLSVKGNSYQLFVNNSLTPILTGSLRQYPGFTPPPGFPNPYTTGNMIVMGDNSSQASAEVTIASVEVN